MSTKECLPLSISQEALWATTQREQGRPVYQIPIPLLIEGHLDVAALRAALVAVGRRHPTLRARVSDAECPALTWEHATDLALVERRSANPVTETVGAAMAVPFDLATGPLIRAELITGPEYRMLLLIVHHLVVDGGSVPSLLADLRAAYTGADLGSGDLTALTAHADRQERLAHGEDGRAHRDFWAEHLGADAPELGLARDGDGTPGQCRRPIGADVLARVDTLARELRSSRFIVMYSVLIAVLHRHTDRRDLVVPIPHHGRTGPVSRDGVGFFSNALPVRHRICRTDTYADLIRDVTDTVRRCLRFAALPLPAMLAAATLTGPRARAVAHGVVFESWRDGWRPDVDMQHIQLGAATLRLVHEPDEPDYELGVLLREDVAGSTIYFTDRAGAFAAGRLDALATDFVALLDEITGGPGTTIGPAGPVIDVADAGAAARAVAAFLAVTAWRDADGQRSVRLRPGGGPAVQLALPGRAERFAVVEQAVQAALRQDATSTGPAAEVEVACGTFALRAGARTTLRGPDAATAAGWYERVVEQVAPDRAMGEFDPLTDAERHTQLLDWNRGLDAKAPDATVHGLIRAVARRQPAAVAVVHGDDRRTYGELLAGAESVARGLMAHGVRPGDLVALLGPRGVAQVEAILGILLAGAAYLPIDPANPPRRREFILRDAQSTYVLDLAAGAPRRADGPELPDVSPESLVYCLYTSGTTGEPKGVLLRHRNVVRLLSNDHFPFAFGQADTWTQFHAYTFDVSAWEMFGCLSTGGRLVVVDEEVTHDPDAFAALLARERVTVLNLTPTVFAHLPQVALPDLRYVILAGEKLSPARFAHWLDRVRLVNMYGPTETVHTTVHEVGAADVAADVSNIGVPLPTTSLYLLDPVGRLLPPGATGEIHVGGAGVAVGYLNRPELTAARFRPNPFGAGALYRTGDLARYRPDGTVEFLGRADRQVKVRGYRVEPAEVEAALRTVPGVADAVVSPEEDRLVAYLLCAGPTPASATVRTQLSAVLPSHLVPAVLRVVDELPRTAHGKLDTEALAQLARPLDAGTSSAPQSATGRAVADVWAQLLGVAAPGAQDSFFALGGHSMLAVRVARALRDRLGVPVSVRDLFLHPHLGDLAEVLQERARPPATPEVALPASAVQRGIWLDEQLEPGTSRYSVPMSWRVHGPVDPGLLEDALAALVERHEILRTAFVARDGEPVQVVGAAWRPQLRRARVAAEQLDEWLAAAAAEPFDLATGRPLRVALVDVPGEASVLFLGVHHLIWDEATGDAFFADLDRLYRAGRPGADRETVWAAYDEDHDLAALGRGLLTLIGRDGSASGGPVPGGPASGGPGPDEPTPHQQRMAFVDRFEAGLLYPHAPTYHNLPLLVRLDAMPDRLATAALDRHDILHTTAAFVDDQLMLGRTGAPVPMVRLDAGEPVRRAWLAEPFDLARGPLLRIAVQPRAEGGAWLILLAHQLIADRATLVTLARELLGERAPDAPPYRVVPDPVDLAHHAVALREPVEPLVLPERRARAAVHVYDAATVRFPLPAGVSQEALLAALTATLSWYSGRREMVIGTLVRPQPDGLGPHANLVPLRLATAPGQSMRALTRQARSRLRDAREHPAAPFDDLVRALAPARDMSRTALFDVLFQRVPGADDDPGTGYGKYDVHLFAGDHSATLVYNAAYYDADQMSAMAAHLLRFVEADPRTAVDDIDPLSPPEVREQLDLGTRGSDPGAAPGGTVVDLLRGHRGVAVCDGDRQWTYAQLLERAESMARGLVARGVRPGDLVGLLLPRGSTQVEAVLSVVLAGAAYLPIDVGTPSERTAFVLDDADVEHVVVADGGEAPEGFAGEVLTVSQLRADPGVTLPAVSPESPLYCIYTSGTTGRPKGVVISHRNVVRLVAGAGFGSHDVWTLFHSYAFDFAVWELFGCLAHGGRLVVVGEREARDAERFAALLVEQRVTVLNQTPSAFDRLMRVGVRLPALRKVIFGGEMLRPSTLGDFRDAHPDVRLINMYGITETTVHVTEHEVTADDIAADRSVIGRPIPTTTVRLVDRHSRRRLLPIGAVGELLVGGEGVADGYLRRPELTAQRFGTDPYGGGRVFHSGDLARYRPDGLLEYVGRADEQVKIRGYRIEPGEIEVCLRRHPAVADAAVLVDDEQRLVAYLCLREAPPSAAELRTHVAAHLPEYMVPGAWRTIGEFPLTGNGKRDHAAMRALAAPLGDEGGDEGAGAAPRTATAGELAQTWSELLDGRSPGADDSFFDLGGHSLLATRLVGRIEETTGVRLRLADIFERPRLQDLADLLDRLRETGEARPDGAGQGSADEGDGTDDGDLAPANDFQQRIWLAEDSAVYHLPLAFRVSGELDVPRLEAALARVVARHEILRTAFVERRGRLLCRVGAPWRPVVTRVDSQDRDDWLLAEARRPFTGGHLLRVALAGDVLLLVLHHLIADGESLPILVEELRLAFEDEAAGAPATRVPRGAADPHADAVDARVAALAGAEPYLPLPQPQRPEPSGAVLVDVPGDVLAAVRDRRGVSEFTVIAAGVAALLHRWTTLPDVTFGVPVSLRDAEHDAGGIGPLLTTVVVRSRLRPGGTLGDVLTGVRDSLLDGITRPAAFGAVLERARVPMRPGRVPYADVTVNAAPAPGPALRLGAATLTPWQPDVLWQAETKVALTVTVLRLDAGVRLALSWRGDRLAAAEAHAMADWLRALLASYDLDRPLDPGHAQAAVPALAAFGDRPRQYREFVTEARSRTDEGLQRRAQALAGAPAYLPLTRPEVPAPHGVLRVEVAESRLAELQRRHQLTRHMVLAALVAETLHRFSGRGDLTFGCPVANRSPRDAGMLGPTMNMAVLRSRRPAGDLFGLVREEMLAALEDQSVPLDALIERLNPPRLPGRTPYLDVLLEVAPTGAGPRLGGTRLEPVEPATPPDGTQAKAALVFSFRTGVARLAYRGDLVSAQEAERLAQVLGDVVRGTREERVVEFESGPAAGGALGVVERVARQDPAAPAIETADGVLTYAELIARADRLASTLPPGPGPEPIALLLPRGADLVIGMLAAWRAGRPFCPIDPAYPRARIEQILADLGAAAVIDAVDPAAGVADFRPREPHRVAYVLYTSGSTGVPKGAAVTHRGLAHLADWHINAFGVRPGDRASQAASVGFDAMVWEVWPYLAAGACVVPYERPVVVPELAAWLADRAITMAFLATPLAEAIWRSQSPLPALRWLFIGGAALTGAPPMNVGYRICNAYGLTETTVVASADVLDPAAASPAGCIGRPIAGTTIRILDPDGNRCPVGVDGELYVAGQSVADGYWGRPEHAADRFTPDGSFRTGDRGRWLPDGRIQFLGRLDRQLNIRGQRIEPGEIEAHLAADPAVASATVQQAGDVLTAYVVAAGSLRDGRALRERLTGLLPAAMVPDAVVWLDELPRTAHDKVDTARLPAPSRADRLDASPAVPPDNPLEQRIAAVWSGVIGVHPVGVEDNFFDLGGNSLKLAQLHERLQQELDLRLPVRRLFEFPTVRSFAASLSGPADGAGPAGDTGPARGDDIRERAARARRSRRRETP